MKLLDENLPVKNSFPEEMVSKLLERYVSHKKQLQEKQDNLRILYNHRPCFNLSLDKINATAHLLALDYYRNNLLVCLQEISEIEQLIEDTKK